MIRRPSYASRCAPLVRVSQSPIFAIFLFFGCIIAHPIPSQIQGQRHTAKVPFENDIELLLVALILLFATFNFSMLRVYYVISVQPWKSPISTSVILYESIHWPEITPSHIITTLHSRLERGICSLYPHYADSESPHPTTCTSSDQPEQYSKRQPDDKSTRILHYDFHISQLRTQIKAFLAQIIYKFKSPNETPESNTTSSELYTKSSILSIRTAPENTSISSPVTSHSPILSLSPNSGFYSLVEISPSLGLSNLPSYPAPQNSISLRNDISHMESRYSHSRRGSPLETISEECEGVTSEVEHQDTVSEHSSALSDPISDIFRTQDLSFIFFRSGSQKDLQTVNADSLDASSAAPHYPPGVVLPVGKSAANLFLNLKEATHAQPMVNGSPAFDDSAVFERNDHTENYHMTNEHKFSKETPSLGSGHNRISPVESGLPLSASTDSSEMSFHSTMTSSKFMSNERLVSNIQGDIVPSTFSHPPVNQFKTQPGKFKEAVHNATSTSYELDVQCAHVPGSGFASKKLKAQENMDMSDLVSIPSEDFVSGLM